MYIIRSSNRAYDSFDNVSGFTDISKRSLHTNNSSGKFSSTNTAAAFPFCIRNRMTSFQGNSSHTAISINAHKFYFFQYWFLLLIFFTKSRSDKFYLSCISCTRNNCLQKFLSDILNTWISLS